MRESADRRNRLSHGGLSVLAARWGRPFGLPPALPDRFFQTFRGITAAGSSRFRTLLRLSQSGDRTPKTWREPLSELVPRSATIAWVTSWNGWTLPPPGPPWSRRSAAPNPTKPSTTAPSSAWRSTAPPRRDAAAQKRFRSQLPGFRFRDADDRVDTWDADDCDPWEALGWETVRVIRYHQYKPAGEVIEAHWLTDFSSKRVSARPLYRLAKSRYGMRHICHHESNSLLLQWLIIVCRVLRRSTPAKGRRGTLPHRSFSSYRRAYLSRPQEIPRLKIATPARSAPRDPNISVSRPSTANPAANFRNGCDTHRPLDIPGDRVYIV
jgi:hypothetical protein